MKSSENKWLLVGGNVVLNDLIEEAICLLDPAFEKYGLKAVVTSGVRTEEKQLSLIKYYAEQKNLFPKQWLAPIELADEDLWTEVWSQLLRSGTIINPPRPAICRYEYVRNGKTMPANRKINLSPHQLGKSFDIGGGGNLRAVTLVISSALRSGQVPMLSGYLEEPSNGKFGAVHCDCDLEYVKDANFE